VARTLWLRAPGSCHYRATSLLGRELRGRLDELAQSSGDGLVPTGHHVLIAQSHRWRGAPSAPSTPACSRPPPTPAWPLSGADHGTAAHPPRPPESPAATNDG
jgi:hypothetical protein